MKGAEDIFKKLGSVGSVKDLIASIGGGITMEPGKMASVPKKKKKRRPPNPGGASREVQQMLRATYSDKSKEPPNNLSLGQ